jgi:hypothetical protein
MQISRFAVVLVACTALVAIPAYAVTDPGSKTKSLTIHLTGNGTDGVSYLFASSQQSQLPWPSSGSSMPWPSSGSIMPSPSDVPELSTWMTMVFGFFAIGMIRYRAVKRASSDKGSASQPE